MKSFAALYFLLLASVPVIAADRASKRDLARAVLQELGVSARFDAYLTRGADQAAGGVIQNAKLHQWQQKLWVQELGWRTVEDAYIAHFETKFTDKELAELLALSKNPVVRKLLDEELNAFRSTFIARNKNFEVFWRKLNSLEFEPPEDVFK